MQIPSDGWLHTADVFGFADPRIICEREYWWVHEQMHDVGRNCDDHHVVSCCYLFVPAKITGLASWQLVPGRVVVQL